MKTVEIDEEEYTMLLKFREGKNHKLKGGKFLFDSFGKVYESNEAYDDTKEHGLRRDNKVDCERASTRTIEANRLAALADDLGSTVDWGSGGENYYVYVYQGDWSIVVDTGDTYTPGLVYMTEETAHNVRKVLNNGEFKI